MRESGSAVPDFLRELDVRVQFEHLEIWDYVLTGESAVERKTIRDLISSIYDGRLFAQCSARSSHYPKAFIIVEGNLEHLDSVLQTQKLSSEPVHLQLSSSVRVLHTRSPRDTALVLTVMRDHLTRVRKTTLQIQRPRKAIELGLQQLYMVSSLPWVGEKLADRLLKAFGTPREVFASTSSQLARVKGIGMIRARKIELALSAAYATTSDKRAIQKRLTDGEGQERSF